MAITLPTKLPDALIQSGHITYFEGSRKQWKPHGSSAQFSSAGAVKELAAEAKQAIDEKRFTDITDKFETQSKAKPNVDKYEGKTIIENEGKPVQITVGSIFTEDGQLVIGPGYGEARAKSGAPDHGFFYHDTGFLIESAQKYATLNQGEVFRHRDIDDLNFVQSALDFFTNGKYSSDDVNAMQEQMTQVVDELAQQIKNGDSPDLSKLQTQVTISGAQVSFSQLLAFQQVGSELKNSFDQLSVGGLDMQRYAQMGIAKAMGNYYGKDKGQVGAMFSSAMDRLYNRGVAQINSQIQWANLGNPGYHPPLTERGQDGIKTAVGIRDIFSELDTSSKENLSRDFSEKLSAVRNMAQKHCSRFHISTSHVSLDGDTAGIIGYFNTQLGKL